MNRHFSNTLKLIAFIGFAVLLLWLVLRNQDLELLKSKLQHANYWFAVVALIFALLSNIVRSYRWNQLIKPLGYKPKVVNTFAALMIGYFTNLGIPRLGEVTRCGALSRYENISATKLFGTVVVERVVDLISIFLLLFLVVVLQWNLMIDFSSQYVFQPLADKFISLSQKGSSIYIVFTVAVIILIILCWIAFKMFRKSKAFIKVKELIAGFVDGLKTIRTLEKPWLFLLNTSLIWIMYLLMSYSCFFSFNATNHLGLLVGLTVMIMGGFGFVAPVQGGFGAYHAIVTQTLVLYSIDESDGLAYAFLMHSTQTVGVILFGILSFIILPIYNRKKPA